jgi:glycosyltransferase involved in cell wall biosynthesis
MDFPLVTVVLCTYNGAKFLEEQINSILAQTYSNIEIIAIDDSSTDNTFKVLEFFSQQSKIFRCYRNKETLGVTKNFEHGILKANGTYIAFSDQDDIWHCDKIKILMQNAENAKLIYCDSELVDENKNTLGKKMSDTRNLKPYNDAMPFLITNCISGHAMIVEKNFTLETLPFSSILIYDRWLAFNAAAEKGIVYVNQPLIYHRQHANNSIGAVKNKETAKPKKSKVTMDEETKKEIEFLYNRCPSKYAQLKEDLSELFQYTRDYSFKNNLNRMLLFFRFKNRLLAIKKRSSFRNNLFCLKMFFKIS